MTGRPRLYVLPPSHYCERARWGLDHAGIAFDEVPLAVGLHVRAVRRIAPRSSVPALLDEGTVIQGSGAILDRTGIGGGDPALEERFDAVIGPLVRQYVYAGVLSERSSGVRDLLLEGVDARQAAFARLLWPLTRRLMAAGMQARPALLPVLEARLESELDWFDARVAGRDHLVGDAFGRADITAASLLSPLALPAEVPLYRRLRLPPPLAATIARWNDRPGLRWVHRTYAMHRRPPAAPRSRGPLSPAG